MADLELMDPAQVDADLRNRDLRIEALEAENVRLRGALEAMVKQEVDYMTINNLGDPEQQHNIIRARAALKAPTDE